MYLVSLVEDGSFKTDCEFLMVTKHTKYEIGFYLIFLLLILYFLGGIEVLSQYVSDNRESLTAIS